MEENEKRDINMVAMEVIYQADHETVYCETSIRVEHLPEELQSSLEEGIALYSDEELYEFLENYSS